MTGWLSEDARIVLGFVRAHQFCTVKQISAAIGGRLADHEIDRILKRLQSFGLVEVEVDRIEDKYFPL
jgi:hypothetical protein